MISSFLFFSLLSTEIGELDDEVVRLKYQIEKLKREHEKKA
jgi:hypothetical protein